MHRILAIGLFSLFTCSAHGQVCVSSVNISNGDRGLILPSPSHPDFGKMIGRQYFVQIDDGPLVAVSKSAGTMMQISDRRKRHLFRVFRDGRAVQSFVFSLSSASDRKCVNFRTLYETWSIESVSSFKDCGCGK